MLRAVADPTPNLLFWKILYRKLHGNERIWTGGQVPGASLDLHLGRVLNSVTSDFSMNSFRMAIYKEILTELEKKSS